jgi:ABC-2 type transport system permease protein
MAGLSLSPRSRGQFVAIAQLRWQLFAHTLRTGRGHLELLSRVIVGLVFSVGALGGAVVLGSAAWYFVSQGKAEWLAALLWSVFAFWQILPVMATAFTENLESSDLLRFPVSYISYFLVRLIYGSMHPATFLSSTWLLGITIGIGFAKLRLLPWAILVLATFTLVNILLSQMIFAWVERWLAQRRTREMLGAVFFLVIITFQFIGPLVARYGHRNSLQTQRMHVLSGVLRTLPPGLAASAINPGLSRKLSSSLAYFLLLCAYGATILYFLNLRLRAQYCGESLSETASPEEMHKKHLKAQLGWMVPGFSEPVSAIFEKELRYLSRSGPMLYTLIMPAVMLLILRMGPMGKGHGLLAHTPALELPIGAAYALLSLTNLVYNNFGPDGVGMQLFFGAPVRFRHVVMGKNLAHLAVLALEMLLVWVGVYVMYAPPSLALAIMTIAGLAFAVPLNFSVGNLLSIYFPKKIEYGTFGRQRASMTTVLASFAVQILVFGVGALAIFVSRRYGTLWIAVLVFGVLAALSISGYCLVLKRVDGIVARYQGTMLSELCKA